MNTLTRKDLTHTDILKRIHAIQNYIPAAIDGRTHSERLVHEALNRLADDLAFGVEPTNLGLSNV